MIKYYLKILKKLLVIDLVKGSLKIFFFLNKKKIQNCGKRYNKSQKFDENKTADKINKNLREKIGKDKIQKISKAKKQHNFQIATLNVRTPKSEEKLLELEHAFGEKKIAIVGLAKVRREN